MKQHGEKDSRQSVQKSAQESAQERVVNGIPGRAKSEGNKDALEALFPLRPITVVTGHYGVGKTNLSVNLALDATMGGQKVTLVDLDIVNPYFRSSDYAALLESRGVDIVKPVFAGSTLDVPSLSGRIYTVLEEADGEDHCVIIDAGGDEVGATALGRFADLIADRDYAMYYVINKYRNLTQSATEAAAVLAKIEAKSQLSATGVINNSHLQSETTEQAIGASQGFAEETADLLGLPLVATVVPEALIGSFSSTKGHEAGTEPKSSVLFPSSASQNYYCVQVYVQTPWEQ